jgi:AcrR family transcriptional regulator
VSDPSVSRTRSRGQPLTRDRILDAAWGLFRTQGFDGTTVTEIEARAGLAAGSGGFYRHFASKEDVLRAVVEREVERADTERELPSEVLTADARIALTLDFQRRLSNLRRLQPLMVVLAREQHRLGGAKGRLRQLLLEKNLNLRAEVLQGWMDQGAIPRRDSRSLATVITASLTGYHNAREYFGDSPGGTDEASFLAMLADLVLGGGAWSDDGRA